LHSGRRAGTPSTHPLLVGGPRAQPFYEWELQGQTVRFGNIAHVSSPYPASDTPGCMLIKRGISSIQLCFDGPNCWITA
jgi:hypothetical protein